MSVISINPYRFGVVYDADAQAYITAVEIADGQALETAVKDAINAFVVGCKADGIWSAIKASCILAGARTLNGALVPLVGTAPTNSNFVAADYNRKTGLASSGTQNLNSNRNNNADPQNSKHYSVFISSIPTGGNHALLGIAFVGTGWTWLGRDNNGNLQPWVNGGGSGARTLTNLTGFAGAARSNSSQYLARNNNYTVTFSGTSEVPASANITIFSAGLSNYSNARLAFYSIGESLDLALLDARVTTLINAFAAAIP